MKKLFVLTIALCAVALVAGSLYCAETSVLKIVALKGDVKVKSSVDTDWTAAKVGRELAKDDMVMSGNDGKAVFAFTDGSSVSIKEDTTVKIEELVWESAMKRVGVRMDAGTLKLVVNKKSSPSLFAVKTPTAMCGVRGTTLYEKGDKVKTLAYVEGGMAELTNTASGKSFTLVNGNGSTAGADGSTTPPGPLALSVLKALKSGFLTSPIAEPYTPPNRPDPRDTNAPGVTPENTASPVKK